MTLTFHKGVSLQLVMAALVVGLAAAGGWACDDGTTEDTGSGEPGLRIFSLDLQPTQGFAPVDAAGSIIFETGDPTATVVLHIDWGDGEQDDLESASSLSPDASVEERRTAQERTVVLNHTYDSPGEYLVRVVAEDVSNGPTLDDPDAEEVLSLEENITIIVEELPDLLAVDVTTAGGEIAIDDLFDVDFTVLNDGSDITRGFFVQIYLVSRPDIRTTDLVDQAVFHSLTLHPTPNAGLARGMSLSESVSVQICNPQVTGTDCDSVRDKLGDEAWYPAIWIDPPNPDLPELNLLEEDDDNNFRVSNVPIALEPLADLPDLSPRDVVANPASTDVLTEVSVSFTVDNLGQTDAPPTTFAVFLSQDDRTLDPTDVRVGEGEIGNILAEGERIIASLNFPLDEAITLPGVYYLLIRADDFDVLPERVEVNNIEAGDRTIVVTGAEQTLFDVATANLTVNPDRTFVGGQYTVAFDVVNMTDNDPGGYQCAVYLSDDASLETATDQLLVVVGEETLGPMDVDTHERILFVSSFTAPGDYYVIAACDHLDLIFETDETNNIQIAPVPLTINAEPQVDYEVSNLTVSDMTIAENGTITITAEVCNLDVDFATPVLVGAYMSADSVVDTNDVEIEAKLTTTASLAPMACETVTLSGKVNCLPFVDTYTIGVLVDPFDNIIESNETNNQVDGAADGLTLTGGAGSFCTCVEDMNETNNNQGEATLVTITGTDPKVGAIAQLALCDANDFFTFDVNRGDVVTASINFDETKGDLDLRLYDPTEMAPTESTGTTGVESITEEILGMTATETIYLEVIPKSGGGRNYYDLDVSIAPAPTEPELQVEEIVLVDGTYPSVVNPVDFDVTIFNDGLTDANNVQVTAWLSTNTLLDMSDLEIGNQIIPVVGTIDREVITFTYTFPMGQMSEQFYLIVEVDPLEAIAEVVETNNRRISERFTIDADCFPDGFEDNDSFATATPVSPGADFTTLSSLSICNNQRDDYFLVCVPAGEALNHVGILQDSPSSSSGMHVRLYDRSLTACSTSNDCPTGQTCESTTGTCRMGTATSTTNVIVSVNVPDHDCVDDSDCPLDETCGGGGYCEDASGDHCVYVQAALRSTASVISRPYELIIDNVAPNQLGEPTNDARADAIDFSPRIEVLADGSGKTNPRDDSDWYFIEVEAGVSFDANLVTGDDDLRLVVYHPSQNVILPYKPETINVSSAMRIDMRVYKVTSGTDRPSGYQIELAGLEGVDLVAENLTGDVGEVANGGAVLVDWDLTNDRLDDVAQPVDYRYLISTDAVLDMADVQVDAKTTTGPPAFTAINIQEKVYATVPATLFGDLYLIVDADYPNAVAEIDETNNQITMPLTVRQLCTDDASETNDTLLGAHVVAAPYSSSMTFGAQLTACENDIDYYQVALTSGVTYTFSVDNMVPWSSGDLDLFLLDSGGAQLDRSDGLNTVSESITYTPTANETVYLQVLPFRTDYTNVFDLTITTM